MSKIIVKDTEINIIKVENEDYICITDMIKAKDGDFFITDWLRNRNTLEYIGVWEALYNSNFNYGEFAIIKSKSGLNNFKISVKEFVERWSDFFILYKIYFRIDNVVTIWYDESVMEVLLWAIYKLELMMN